MVQFSIKLKLVLRHICRNLNGLLDLETVWFLWFAQQLQHFIAPHSLY